MSDQLQSISGVDVLVGAADGPPVGAGTVLDLVGDVVQKLTNYRLRLAVLGDIAPQADASTALRDWVREANRGTTVWFVADLDELAGRLAGAR